MLTVASTDSSWVTPTITITTIDIIVVVIADMITELLSHNISTAILSHLLSTKTAYTLSICLSVYVSISLSIYCRQCCHCVCEVWRRSLLKWKSLRAKKKKKKRKKTAAAAAAAAAATTTTTTLVAIWDLFFRAQRSHEGRLATKIHQRQQTKTFTQNLIIIFNRKLSKADSLATMTRADIRVFCQHASLLAGSFVDRSFVLRFITLVVISRRLQVRFSQKIRHMSKSVSKFTVNFWGVRVQTIPLRHLQIVIGLLTYLITYLAQR